MPNVTSARNAVYLSMSDSRVFLTCGWYPGVADDCRRTSGARWMKEAKQWSYPLSMQTLRSLREVFGERLVVAPDLWQWAKVERATERATATLGAAADAEITLIPQISDVLAQAMAQRTYQRSGARFIASAGNCCVADQPGLGKTAMSLGGLMESGLWGGVHLIVSPVVSINSVWRRQIEMWGSGVTTKVVTLTGSATNRRANLEAFMDMAKSDSIFVKMQARFLVINPAMLARKYGDWCKNCEAFMPKKKDDRPAQHQWEGHKTEKRAMQIPGRVEDWSDIIDFKWDSIILDESHKVLASYRPSNVTQQTAGLLDVRGDAKLIALTGTPLRGQELKIWGTLNWLYPKRFSSFWEFVGTYFEVHDNGFGKEIGELREEKREEFHAVVDRYVLRRTRAEVRSDLPLGERNTVLVDLEGAHKKEYQEFEKMGEIAIEDGSIASLGLLSELTRLKQLAWGRWRMGSKGKPIPFGDSPKMDFIKEFLSTRGVTGDPKTDFLPEEGSGYKYVIASQFTEVLEFIQESLNADGISSYLLSGKATTTKRDTMQREFQESHRGDGWHETRVFLLQTQTGGESIELDAWCDEMIIVDQTWIADDQVQLEGRINNRSGRVAPRTWWYLVTADTIDQRIAENNEMQHNLEHNLLDGRRGVEIALHLLGRN